MTEIVAVGGFGSTLRQYESLADKLHTKFGPDSVIDGVNFYTAISDPESLADKIHHRHIKTHSLGACALSRAVEIGAIPASIDMVAPPAYEQWAVLAINGLRYDMRQRRNKKPALLEDLSEHEANQILHHPRAHAGAVTSFSRFPTLSFATECTQLDIPTRVGLMENDGLFRLGQYPRDELERALAAGVGVRLLAGNHTRFTREPVQVLNELDWNPNVNLTDWQFDSSGSTGLDIGRAASVLSGLLQPAKRAA